MMVEVLHDTRDLNFMVALGRIRATPKRPEPPGGHHAEERATTFKHVGLLNHAWDDPAALTRSA